MHQHVSIFDDIVLMFKLVSVSSPFDAEQRCEAKWKIEGSHGTEGQLNIQTTDLSEAIQLKIGDTYGVHMRRL